MRAIILAAGKGKRLVALTQHCPKSLIPVGGVPILSRFLGALEAVGIKDIVIVVGYLEEKMTQFIKDSHPHLNIQTTVNPDYLRGSILSLWAAREFFNDDLLIMDADVLFPKQFLSMLIQSPHPDLMLLDQSVQSHGEEQMLLIKNNRVIDCTKKVQGKGPEDFDLMGEGIGFLKISRSSSEKLKQIIKDFVKQGEVDMEYEDTFHSFFNEVDVKFLPVGGMPWTEIDFPEDIQKAEKSILPKLLKYEQEHPLWNT
ncbi:MAG TPA: phosphocholine cytidylyltransferase family protein [Nitrospiria bacterium]|jgi:choline kinase